jgi:hypothetical protein
VYKNRVTLTEIEEVEGNALAHLNTAMLATMQEMDNTPEQLVLDEDYPSSKRSCIVSSYGTRSKTPAPSQARGKAKAKTATKAKNGAA